MWLRRKEIMVCGKCGEKFQLDTEQCAFTISTERYMCSDCTQELVKQFKQEDKVMKKRGRPLGHKLSQKTKDLIREAKKDQKHTEETKQKIRETLLEYFDEVGRKDRTSSCEGCGATIMNSVYYEKTYCKDCNDKYFSNGEKGEYAAVRDKLRYKNEYKLWRLKVLIRDKFLCRCCGGAGQCVHHLIDLMEIKDIPELLYNTDVGITLCNVCHGNIHAEIRKNKVLKEI